MKHRTDNSGGGFGWQAIARSVSAGASLVAAGADTVALVTAPIPGVDAATTLVAGAVAETATGVATVADASLCVSGECNWTNLSLDVAGLASGGAAEYFRSAEAASAASKAVESSARAAYGGPGLYDAISFGAAWGALPMSLYSALSGN